MKTSSISSFLRTLLQASLPQGLIHERRTRTPRNQKAAATRADQAIMAGVLDIGYYDIAPAMPPCCFCMDGRMTFTAMWMSRPCSRPRLRA